MFFNLPKCIITKIFEYDQTYHIIFTKLKKEFFNKTPFWKYIVKYKVKYNNINDDFHSYFMKFNELKNGNYSKIWLEYYTKTYPSFYNYNKVILDYQYVSDNKKQLYFKKFIN